MYRVEEVKLADCDNFSSAFFCSDSCSSCVQGEEKTKAVYKLHIFREMGKVTGASEI